MPCAHRGNDFFSRSAMIFGASIKTSHIYSIHYLKDSGIFFKHTLQQRYLPANKIPASALQAGSQRSGEEVRMSGNVSLPQLLIELN